MCVTVNGDPGHGLGRGPWGSRGAAGWRRCGCCAQSSWLRPPCFDSAWTCCQGISRGNPGGLFLGGYSRPRPQTSIGASGFPEVSPLLGVLGGVLLSAGGPRSAASAPSLGDSAGQGGCPGPGWGRALCGGRWWRDPPGKRPEGPQTGRGESRPGRAPLVLSRKSFPVSAPGNLRGREKHRKGKEGNLGSRKDRLRPGWGQAWGPARDRSHFRWVYMQEGTATCCSPVVDSAEDETRGRRGGGAGVPLRGRDHWQPSSEGHEPEGAGLGVAHARRCPPRSPPHSAPALRGNLPLSSIMPRSWKSGALFPSWWMGGQGLGKPWGV